MPTPRNPVARAPILRKGGVHQRARSGERQQARQALDELLLDGLEEYQDHVRETAEKRAGDKDVLPDPTPAACLSPGFLPAVFFASSRPNPHTV